MKWIRSALAILRHDLTQVSLFVAFGVLAAGVYGATMQRGQAVESASLAAAVSAPASAPAQSDAVAPSVSTAEASSETPFVPELATDAGPVAPSHRIFEGELERGETLSSALNENGVSSRLVHTIATEMGKLYNSRRAKPGHDYRLELDPAGELVEFRYAVSPIESYYVTRSDVLIKV